VGTAPVTSLSRPCSGESCRTILRMQKKQIVYARGAKCDALFYIQKGKKIIVVSFCVISEITSNMLGGPSGLQFFRNFEALLRSRTPPRPEKRIRIRKSENSLV